MKKFTFPILGIFVSGSAFAQQDFYALTGPDVQQIIFQDFRSLDTKAGISGKAVFSADSPSNVFSQTLNSKVTEPKDTFHQAQATQIATLATDISGSHLYYSPLYSSNIYVLDIKSQQITLIENEILKPTTCSLASQFTRMTAGKDGAIYAMTNSGSQLVKISEINGSYEAQNLGAIKDITANNEISLSVVNSGYGGDMIADAEGNLWVFAASGNIFKVNIERMTSESIGRISGLPEGFSTNGVAVDASGNVLVGSAKGDILYQIDMESLEAKASNFKEKLNVYDLASKYFLNDVVAVAEVNTFSGITIYPTEVKQSYFNVRINNKEIKGNVKVTLTDFFGNTLLSENMMVQNGEKRFNFKTQIPGSYIVNITDAHGKVLHSEKIIVSK